MDAVHDAICTVYLAGGEAIYATTPAKMIKLCVFNSASNEVDAQWTISVCTVWTIIGGQIE